MQLVNREPKKTTWKLHTFCGLRNALRAQVLISHFVYVSSVLLRNCRGLSTNRSPYRVIFAYSYALSHMNSKAEWARVSCSSTKTKEKKKMERNRKEKNYVKNALQRIRSFFLMLPILLFLLGNDSFRLSWRHLG